MEKPALPNNEIDLEIKRAAQLSLAELSIGTVGHAFKIPMTGHVLSLNQLAFLLNAINKDKLEVASVFEISGIAALLKSFSLAGQKLGPMFSIATQGFLFWFFNFIFSKNFLGQILGALFLSLWAFIQPLITYFFIYGFDLIKMFNFYEQKLAADYSFIHDSLIFAFCFVLVLKISIAVTLVIYSVKTQKEIKLIDDKFFKKIPTETFVRTGNSSKLQPFRQALRDLTRPLFVLSFVLLILFISNLESSLSQKIWYALRPLATAFLLFYFMRSPWFANKLNHFAQKYPRLKKYHVKSKKALDLVAQWSTRSSEVSSRRQGE